MADRYADGEAKYAAHLFADKGWRVAPFGITLYSAGFPIISGENTGADGLELDPMIGCVGAGALGVVRGITMSYPDLIGPTETVPKL